MTELKPLTVALSGGDLVWLAQIVMDKDKDEALRFMEMLSKQVEQQQKSQMKRPL